MKLLILGGSRFIGRYVAQQAQAAGHEVTLFNRGKSWPEAPFDQIHGDMNALIEHRETLLAVQADAVLHCLAMTPQHAQDFVSVFEGSTAQLHVLSSADVYAAFQWLVKGRDDADWPISERSPVTDQPFYWREVDTLHMQDYDKNQVTSIIQGAFPQALVYRLPMVYGPHDAQYAHRHGWILQHLLHEQTEVVLGLNQQATLWTYGYVENIAAALLTGIEYALANPGVLQGVYNLGEVQCRTWRRWVERFYASARQDLTIRSVPDTWQALETKAPVVPQHFVMDVSRFPQATGFQAPVDLETAVKRTLDWGLAHTDSLGDRPDFEARLKAWKTYQLAEATAMTP